MFLFFVCLWPEGGERGAMGYEKGPHQYINFQKLINKVQQSTKRLYPTLIFLANQLNPYLEFKKNVKNPHSFLFLISLISFFSM
jgi:hypothetical protein